MNKFKQKIASLMIFLVVMIPVYSATVFADLTVDVRGSDNIPNIMKETDLINFKAIVSIPGDEITPNQVVLGANLQFDSCQQGITGFECKLRFPAAGENTFDGRAVPYTVTLKNDNGNNLETKSGNMVVDNLAPEIVSFDVRKENSNYVFSYSIEDRACDGSGCSGFCSGISKIELSDTSGFKETISINKDSCSFSGEFEKAANTFSDGEHTVLAKAFDKLNQASSQSSVSFEIDTTPPFIDLNTFKITDETDVEIEHFGKKLIPVTVKVEIRGSDLNRNGVFADLSQLNKNLPNAKASCAGIGEITTCSWNINLDAGTAGLKAIKVTASDLIGNNAEAEISRNFDLDINGPVVLSLASSRTFEGQSFAKPRGNTFTATLIESGIGLKPSDIRLHVNNFVKAADSCEFFLDTWQCTWNNVDVNNRGKVNVFIGQDSTDRLGNNVLEQFSKEVTVDATIPKLLKLVVKNIGGIESASGEFIKTGDKLQVEAALEDDTLESATADFSRFIFNAKNVAADDCIDTGARTFVCSWTTSSIDIEGFISDLIRFEFADVAGNALIVNKQLTVFGIDEETAPDFWISEARCSPSLLDRETMPLVSQRSFCQVTLTPKSLINQIGRFEDLTTLDISLGQCNGDLNFVESFELLNNEVGSVEPFIKVNFRQQDVRVNELNYLCPISIITKRGNEIVTVPETENINFSFKFYNLPLGELSESVEKKIDDALDDADNALKVATFFKKVFFYASRICQFVNLIAQVAGFFMVINEGWVSADIATKGVPGVNGPITVGRMLNEFTTENFREKALQGWKWINPICGMVNCKYNFEEGEAGTILGGVETFMHDWQQGGRDLLNKAPFVGGDFVAKYTGDPLTAKRDISSYMNPKDSIAVAVMTACIPGIIYGIDKARQIQCLYADCLQTGVGEQGLPVFACEDQKDYAICKYVVGEVFKVIPITAIINYYTNLLKNTLNNPFNLIGLVPGYVCKPTITPETPGLYRGCAVVKIVSLIGETLQEITSIVDEGAFEIRDDFCERLDLDKKDEKKEQKK